MIAERVVSIISEVLEADAAEVSPSTALTDLGADISDIVEIIFRCEREFNVTAGDVAAKMVTAGDVVGVFDDLTRDVIP